MTDDNTVASKGARYVFSIGISGAGLELFLRDDDADCEQPAAAVVGLDSGSASDGDQYAAGGGRGG
ncbi:unnamed protein product [marine sediment metagenome]|uniref:Uncharacterized protein n=1 Tax=marine sediment metagenome TaxID=412755 RepID=X1H429_9ZZZZ